MADSVTTAVVQRYPKAQEGIAVSHCKIGDLYVVSVCYFEHATSPIAIDNRGNIVFSDKRNALVDDDIFNIEAVANENRASSAHVVYGFLNCLKICWPIVVHSHRGGQRGCLPSMDSVWNQK